MPFQSLDLLQIVSDTAKYRKHIYSRTAEREVLLHQQVPKLQFAYN